VDEEEITMEKDIFQRIDAHLQNHRMGAWTGTFRDYLGMVIKQPVLARRAHARLYNMIKSAGVQVDEEGKEHYAFFENDLFGIDEPLARVVEYFKAAAMGSDVGRRILLLYGPPSSGKSQLVILLKRGLEAYTQTEEGAAYAIADCPQHEDPLNLMPHALRREFQDETGIQIEGEFCPLCAFRLEEVYQGDIYQVLVKRIFFSEKARLGIGTFVPSDPKSQDISELVGSIDLSTIGDYGSESDPRAYRFDGELNVANRGLMEFIKMLKADERFLYVLLTLSQEKNIKFSDGDNLPDDNGICKTLAEELLTHCRMVGYGEIATGMMPASTAGLARRRRRPVRCKRSCKGLRTRAF
jgi:serine protein kinase